MLSSKPKRLDIDFTRAACLDCTHEIEHDRPSHHRVDNHLPPLFVQGSQWPDDVVTRLVQQGSVVVFFNYSLLLDVCFKEKFLAVAPIKAIERVQRHSPGGQANALHCQVHMAGKPTSQ